VLIAVVELLQSKPDLIYNDVQSLDGASLQRTEDVVTRAGNFTTA
jgi:hypothetical protein